MEDVERCFSRCEKDLHVSDIRGEAFVDSMKYYDGPDAMLRDVDLSEVNLTELREMRSDIDDEDAAEWVKALGTTQSVDRTEYKRMKSEWEFLQEISDKLSVLIELLERQVS